MEKSDTIMGKLYTAIHKAVEQVGIVLSNKHDALHEAIDNVVREAMQVLDRQVEE